jgi:hypothetical protein
MTPEQALWSEVLYAAVTDAVEGVAVIGSQNTVSRMNDNERARRYIMHPNAGFNQVCYLAGLNPDAVREHVSRKIAKAPTSAELAGCKREITKQTRAKPAPKPAPKAKPRPAQTLTHNGQTRTIYDWASIIGVSHMTIHLRLRKGWSIEAALTPKPKREPKPKHEPKPKQSRRTFVTLTYQGQTLKLAEWAKIVGVSLPTLCQRRKHGWTVEAMLTTPLTRHGDKATLLARRGLTLDDAQTPGVPYNLAQKFGTGGNSFARPITEINFSQDCAA